MNKSHLIRTVWKCIDRDSPDGSIRVFSAFSQDIREARTATSIAAARTVVEEWSGYFRRHLDALLPHVAIERITIGTSATGT